MKLFDVLRKPVQPSMQHTSIRLEDLDIAVTFKRVRHVYLSVHPPGGNVTLVAPAGTRLEAAQAYAISRLDWIRRQQARIQGQPRETPRQFVTQESHYIWGEHHLLDVVERDAPPSVTMDRQRITLNVRPGADRAKRAAVYHRWQRELLHAAVPTMISRWEERLGVKVTSYFLRHMKTKWGSCHPFRAHIRLNTELVKKPPALLEYVIVHEMVHLLEPSHNARFHRLMDQFYPTWREAKRELNALPLETDA
ncbi:MAG: M48 family metallopeptidase [Azoarcus sp.]|jgi:predicted metal-dependent hydrolase|nr:M48 family metallopeptidase [Azoarcus sp.]